MKPQKNSRGMLPQFSRSAMLVDVLDPRRQKKKLNLRRKPGEKPAIINMPHKLDTPIQLIKLLSGSPSATQSCNNNTQNLPPKRFLTDRRQEAVNNKLWEFLILLWTQEETIRPTPLSNFGSL
jgi:hypothetical protein